MTKVHQTQKLFGQLEPILQKHLFQTNFKKIVDISEAEYQGKRLKDQLEKGLREIGMDWLEYELFDGGEIWVHKNTMPPVDAPDGKVILCEILKKMRRKEEYRQEADEMLEKIQELSSALGENELFTLSHNYESGIESTFWLECSYAYERQNSLPVAELKEKLSRVETFTQKYLPKHPPFNATKHLMATRFGGKQAYEEMDDNIQEIVSTIASQFEKCGFFLNKEVERVIREMNDTFCDVNFRKILMPDLAKNVLYIERKDRFKTFELIKKT